MQKILSFLKKKDPYIGICRYALGLWMIPYALTKILRTQFVVLPSSAWQLPLEKISTHTLAWAFLGYSPWFQILLGCLELTPALLLLFRRTTLLGAMLLLPMTLNVYLINMALNLWDTTKVISLILLSLNCLVLLLEWKRIREIILIVISRARLKFTIWEVLINLVLVGFVGYSTLGDLFDYRAQRNALTGDWLNHHPYEWKLISEKLNDSTLQPKSLKIYFGSYGGYSEISVSGVSKMNDINYKIDEKKMLIGFYNSDNQLINKGTYSIKGDTLRINKVIDSARNSKLVQVFQRRVINQ